MDKFAVVTKRALGDRELWIYADHGGTASSLPEFNRVADLVLRIEVSEKLYNALASMEWGYKEWGFALETLIKFASEGAGKDELVKISRIAKLMV